MMLHLKFHALEAVSRNYAPATEPILSRFAWDLNTIALLLWGHIPRMGLKRHKQVFQSFQGELLWQLFWVPPQWAFEHFGETFASFTPALLQAWEEKQVYFKAHLPEVLTHYEREQVSWMGCQDAKFPESLKQIHESPALLFYKGDENLLQAKIPFLSVVGTRQVSHYATTQMDYILGGFPENSLCIVSGLANGVDTVAHERALSQGLPTIAILAGGLDFITPTSNYSLAERIVEAGGLLLSEMPLGVPPVPKSFPRRNRLIVGLSPALWVVEGGLQSGTMISARIALEESRDVCVLPMDIDRDGAAGPLKLLKEGAMPITGSQDIADLLGFTADLKSIARPKRVELIEPVKPIISTSKNDVKPVLEDISEAVTSPLTKEKETLRPRQSSESVLIEVLEQAKNKQLHVDSLALLSGKNVTEVLSELSLLEITGEVERLAGNIFKRL